MDESQKHYQIKAIYRMLLALANGNLGYRMELDGSDTSFDELAVMLNDLAGKLFEVNYSNPYITRRTSLASFEDTTLLLVQRVLDYIHTHLEEPLPSTKALSKMFGTNEFTLKANFRKVVKTSIYQFYNNKRLEKAHLLIEKTPLPLKNIALLCGFKNYTIFYKAFKKKYSYKPSEVPRNESKESEK